MKIEHTPLPWFTGLADDMCEIFHLHEETPVSIATIDNRQSIFSEVLPDGKETGVYNLFPKESSANAAFIVRACNAHYELVSALECAIKYMDISAMQGRLSGGVTEGMRAALAKAKESK